MLISRLEMAAQVTSHLLKRYGPQRLSEVEQLAPAVFRGRLSDGVLALAVFCEDGNIAVKEVEPCWT